MSEQQESLRGKHLRSSCLRAETLWSGKEALRRSCDWPVDGYHSRLSTRAGSTTLAVSSSRSDAGVSSAQRFHMVVVFRAGELYRAGAWRLHVAVFRPA